MDVHTRRLAETTFAVVDVETTGIDPRRDGIVEVACVLLRAGERVATYSTLVDPGRPIPCVASAVHHLTDMDVAGAPRLDEIVPRLRALTADAVIVAHNASFDLRFLSCLTERPSICSLRFARLMYPDAPNHKNQVLRYYLRIEDAALSGLSAHRALGDAIVTSRIFSLCLQRYRAEGGADDLASLLARTQRARRAGDPCHPVESSRW